MAIEQQEEVVLSPDDEFAEAFGQAVGAVEPAKEENKDEQADAAADGGGEKKGTEEGEGGAEGGDKVPGEADKPASETGATEGDAGKQGEQPVTNPNAELIEAIKGLVPKAPVEDKKPDDKKPEILPEPELYQYTEDEKKVIESYAKEWDDHDRAWTIREKKLTHDLTARLSHQFTQALGTVLQQIEQGLAPVIQSQVESAEERHFSAIRKAHSDFDAVKPEVQAWIKTQPKYLQPHLQKTYDEGETDDVIELVTNFKTATGRPQPQVPGAQPSSKGAAPKKDAVPTHKAAELAPVDSKRTSVEAGSSGAKDMADYDGGFEEALARMNK